MKRSRMTLIAIATGLTGAAPLSAQYAPRPLALAQEAARDTLGTQRPAPQAARRPNDAGMLGGGVAFGAAGMLVGGFAGASVACRGFAEGNEFCGLIGFVYGGAIGESLLLPLGVHLANGRRGNYATSALASAAIGLAGVAVAVGSGSAVPLVVVPIAQLGVSIAIERATSRRRQEASR